MWQIPSAKQECRNCAYMRDLGDGECICGKDPSITVMEEYQEQKTTDPADARNGDGDSDTSE